jgi:hypothetical protein
MEFDYSTGGRARQFSARVGAHLRLGQRNDAVMPGAAIVTPAKAGVQNKISGCPPLVSGHTLLTA